MFDVNGVIIPILNPIKNLEMQISDIELVNIGNKADIGKRQYADFIKTILPIFFDKNVKFKLPIANPTNIILEIKD